MKTEQARWYKVTVQYDGRHQFTDLIHTTRHQIKEWCRTHQTRIVKIRPVKGERT